MHMNSATGGIGIDRINWIADIHWLAISDVLFVLVSDELSAAFLRDNLVTSMFGTACT
jgi:hypothetical protein